MGCRFLGRDPETGAALDQPLIAGLSAARLRRLTTLPRRYGLHATLRAPFRLRDGVTQSLLERGLAAFAASRQPVSMPNLVVSALGPYLALRPAGRSPAADALAADCLNFAEPFRRPLAPTELARRRDGALSPRQNELLGRWGYPFVFQEFRFHLTLSDPLSEAELAEIMPRVATYFARSLEGDFILDEIALFEEPGPAEDFRLVRRYELGR